MAAKTGILLVNLGTPKSPAPGDVFRYLNEFLTDERVIDVPWLWRQLLVRGVIVPKRFRQSSATYQKIWTDEGSPLLIYGRLVRDKLQEALGPDFVVCLGMRYQEPSLADALKRLKSECLEHLVILPLFPQYASATTGSVHQSVMEIVKDWNIIPSLSFVSSYATHPAFLDTLAAIGAQYRPETYDHILFSFHGLPERQIKKADETQTCLASPNCCERLHKGNFWCYRAQCYATAQGLASRLKLAPEGYSITFQSRLGKEPWTTPYTEETVRQLAKKGIKRLLVFAPAFTADCLETTYEIGIEYAHLFTQLGGTTLQLVESLNAHPDWISALHKLVLEHCPVANA